MTLDFNPLKAICQETAQTRLQGVSPPQGYSDTKPTRKGQQGAPEAAVADAGTLQREIREGIRAGDDPTFLLLKAVECIGILTGNRLFGVDATEDMRLVMPGALDGGRLPLQWRMEETRERLARLRSVYESGDPLSLVERERVVAAISAHVDALESMEREIEKEGKNESKQ